MVKYYSDKELEKIGSKYNNIFTMFQKLDEKLARWQPLSKVTKDKWNKILVQQQIEVLEKQTKEMRIHTRWFIGLIITNIIVLIFIAFIKI